MSTASERHEVFLGLGSNLGDREAQLSEAVHRLEKEVGFVIGKSSVYKSAPWGNVNQPFFYNQVLRLLTDLGPMTLLASIRKIEDEMGRSRNEKWGPRTIDIDILYFSNTILDVDDLQIPHPEITERRFVLVPMAELAPDFLHPIFKLTQTELLHYCEDESEVELCAQKV